VGYYLTTLTLGFYPEDSERDLSDQYPTASHVKPPEGCRTDCSGNRHSITHGYSICLYMYVLYCVFTLVVRYAVIASGCAGCPKLHCERPGCGMDFCYHCKQPWHANQTCAAARAKRLSSMHSLSSMSHSLDSNIGSCAAASMFCVVFLRRP